MVTNIITHTDIVNDWLKSCHTVRICGQDLKPVPHSLFPDRALSIIKGQGAVYFLKQVPYKNIWLLKIFTPGRRPEDNYLKAVSRHLPGTAEFFTCKQRRLITRDHFDLASSGFRNPNLLSLIEGAILMQKVPGMTWASIADDLRESKIELSTVKRLRMCISLAVCISMLEAGQCSHRDISSLNVFFDENGRAYLIDWDSLYHPRLPFQCNTPVGTMGYIAPFLKATEGGIDGASTWCTCADRFALAALIIEILLIGPDTTLSNEDGSLFSQEQIDTRNHEFVRDQIEKLKQISNPFVTLAQHSFSGSSFTGCPSPGEWLGALKYTLKKHENTGEAIEHQSRNKRIIRRTCNECKTSIRMQESKIKMLEAKGQSPLCQDCLKLSLNKKFIEKAQKNIEVPQVFCEYCQKSLRLPRQKFDLLIERGKPILCATCLKKQIKKWQVEYHQKYRRVTCGACKIGFNIRKNKLDILKHKGKQVLCKDCLRDKLLSGNRSKIIFSNKKVGFASSLWKLIGRTKNDYYS